MHTWKLFSTVVLMTLALTMSGCGEQRGGTGGEGDAADTNGGAEATAPSASPEEADSDEADEPEEAEQSADTEEAEAAEESAESDEAEPEADASNSADESNEDAEEQADAESDDSADEDASATEAMRAFEDDGDVVELTIEGNDLMQFNEDRFTVEAGQMVRLTLEHVGQLGVAQMGHNVVILEQGEDVFGFGTTVIEGGGSLENDFLPMEVRDRVIAFTEMIGGGESTTVEFKAPEEPGDYPFLCTFTGHFAQMNGVFVVE